MSEETDIIEKKYPMLKIVLDYCLKRVELFVVAIILTGGLSFFSDKNARKAVWQEAGPHLMDAHSEIYSNKDAIKDLREKIDKLESQMNSNKTNQ